MIRTVFLFYLTLGGLRAEPISVYLGNATCLEQAIQTSGLNPDKLYVVDYDCTPLKQCPTMNTFLLNYLWCSGAFINGTCQINMDHMKNHQTKEQIEIIEKCKSKVSGDTTKCANEMGNCYLPMVAQCKN